MSSHIRTLPRAIFAVLRSDRARDVFALFAVLAFITVIILWSSFAADQITLRRYT